MVCQGFSDWLSHVLDYELAEGMSGSSQGKAYLLRAWMALKIVLGRLCVLGSHHSSRNVHLSPESLSLRNNS